MATLKIIYNTNIPAHLQIKERLERMSLAHDSEIDINIQNPSLTDGKQNVQGLEAIDLYLDDLKNELHNWYYGSC